MDMEIFCSMEWLPKALLLMFLELSFLPEAEAALVNLRGVGASFPNEVYKDWIPAYTASRQAHVQLEMTYKPVGSDSGKRAIVENPRDIEYAGSDSPLSAEQQQDKDDLVLFPTLAGGTVLAYNLPGCDVDLNLTRDHVVGIFNGTYRYWNDSSLQDINADCLMPNEKIRVIARFEQSGTTSMLTEALSSFSQKWKEQFGNFSEGVNQDTDLPKKWNKSVVYTYGKTNNGMSGMVLSLRYSIGYIVVSAAAVVDLRYARIQNQHGQFTKPTSDAIQKAMDSFASDQLTVSLADGHLEGAYPIASYSYFIIYKEAMKNCNSAKELVRYINWFLTSQTARQACENHHMVPLSQVIAKRVQSEILEKVTCQGENIWQAVKQDMEKENEKDESWILGVYIAVPIFSGMLLAMLGYIVWQRYKLIRMIDSDEWEVPIEEIVFFEDRQQQSTTGKSRLQCMMSLKSFVSIADIPDGQEMLSQILQWPGKWKANTIGIRLLEVKELRQVTRTLKKTMLWMRDSILHANVIRFYGLTEVELERYAVGEYCSKGSMLDILQNDKYNLNNDFKFSLAADIASGMTFLHANNIVHGSLTSSCCLIDSRWTVKIADWEYCRMLTTLFPKKSPLLMLFGKDEEGRGSHALAFKQFWLAPEIVRAEFLQAPTCPADVYSFGVVLQEIYTREDPYSEHADTLSPQQVVRAICNNHLRPQINEDIPIRIRQIMEIAWSDNPAFRPTFEQIVKMLRQSRTTRKTVLDSMMEAMEEYTQHLEEQIAERSAEVTLAKTHLDTFLSDSVPQHLVSQLVNGETTKLTTGETVQGRVYDHLGLLMLELQHVQDVLQHTHPKHLLLFLTDLCAGIDHIVRRYGAYRAAVLGEMQTIVLGLESETVSLDQRCALVAHLAFEVVDFVSNMAPLTSKSQATSVSMRAGVNVGKVVTGVIGGAAPKFILLGEGLDVTKAMLLSSDAGKVRVSRNVFSHLEKNLDFVSEDAGWIFCSGMEIESFWIRLRIPKKLDSVPSDNSIDSGVDLEKSRPDSGDGESVEGEQGTSDVTTDDPASHSRRGSAESARDSNLHQRFLQPFPQLPGPSQQRQLHRQQQQLQQTLSDITEEDERQNSPLFQQQQQNCDQQSFTFDASQNNRLNNPPVKSHVQRKDYMHLVPEVTVLVSDRSQSNSPMPVIDGNVSQSKCVVHMSDSQSNRNYFPSSSLKNLSERINSVQALSAAQSLYTDIPVSTHTAKHCHTGHPSSLQQAPLSHGTIRQVGDEEESNNHSASAGLVVDSDSLMHATYSDDTIHTESASNQASASLRLSPSPVNTERYASPRDAPGLISSQNLGWPQNEDGVIGGDRWKKGESGKMQDTERNKTAKPSALSLAATASGGLEKRRPLKSNKVVPSGRKRPSK